MTGSRFLAPLVAVTRDGGEGWTSLTRAGRVRIDYRLDASGVATLRHALGSMARLARAAGAVEVIAAATPIVRHDTRGAAEATRFDAFLSRLAAMDFGPNRGTVFSAHQMGTLRMGDDPKTSVCDRFGKFHDLENLYCADGAVFVTSSGFNPTLTIQALALRTAGNIVFPGSPERVLQS